jgi:lipoprotein-releasing system permease protein
MKLSFQIAKRFLSYNKGQTILIILGIALGISVQIFIGLLISGLQTSLVDKTIGSSAHISVSTEVRGESFTLDQAWLSTLQNDERLTKVGISVSGPAFGVTDEQSQSVLIRGLSQDSLDIAKIETKLSSGRLAKNQSEIVVGKGLAEQLKLSLNDTLTLQTPSRKTVEVTVVGIADLKVAAINDSWVIGTTAFAQDLLDMGNKISTVEIQVKDVFKADVLATELTPKVPSGLKMVDWKAQNAELLSGLNGQSVSTYMIQVFVLISVVLGIASTLAITVLQKSRQIGILKAMGINDNNASLIFIFQGLILGVFGGLLGMGLGYGLLQSFTTFAKSADGTPIIPIKFDIPFILASGSIAVFSSLLASFIPARKSKKLSPIEVIRNG